MLEQKVYVLEYSTCKDLSLEPLSILMRLRFHNQDMLNRIL